LITGPPWLLVAQEELRRGVKEFPGEADNPRIIEYHDATNGGFTDDEVPWCSSFVNWSMEQCNVSRTVSARARSWLGWGCSISHPPIGAVTILQRGGGVQPGPEVIKAPGHVGFYVGLADDENLLLLGGNQGNAVNVRAYPLARVLGYRWPS